MILEQINEKKKKYAKNYGSKAGHVHEIINNLLKEHFQSDLSECGMQADSYIYHKCMQRVEKLTQLLQIVEMEKNAFIDMLHSSVVSMRRSKSLPEINVITASSFTLTLTPNLVTTA